ncbi:MAG TPA: WD40 repeat domain-containing protein [Xanthobacteraceae bacterium]|nr:WD40 repeat domain-containing protein [Xanthobacteraceae bacterium]
MSEAASIPSIANRVRAIGVDAPVVAVHFLHRTAAFVLGEEAVLLVDDQGERRATPHAGAILSVGAGTRQIVTGGDDGRVVATDEAGQVREIARDEKGRWIDQVAVAPEAVAWSAGKSAFVLTNGKLRSIDLASSAGGLAFAPKGFRLAVAHYDGATLWFPNASAKPETLPWHGSHLGVTFSPDGRFLVTTMQEPLLHGWRLADSKHMRMSGYAAKVRSLSWSADGHWLATSGSEQLILWPFQGRDGPMGKQPRILAPLPARCVAVACHPKQDITAVGYADGTVLLVRISDGAEILVRPRDGHAISALAWSPAGDRLAFGTEEAGAGLVTL